MSKITHYTVSAVLLTAFALMSLACGSVREAAARQQKANDLMQIGLAYHSYCDQYNKGPAKADDLLPFIENNALLLQKMKSDYTIIWGVNLRDMMQFADRGTSQTVLGYENNPTGGQRVVLLADGSTKFMTESEFSSTTKAKSGSSK